VDVTEAERNPGRLIPWVYHPFVAEHPGRRVRMIDLVLAVNEVATNSVRHVSVPATGPDPANSRPQLRSEECPLSRPAGRVEAQSPPPISACGGVPALSTISSARPRPRELRRGAKPSLVAHPGAADARSSPTAVGKQLGRGCRLHQVRPDLLVRRKRAVGI
jgi:hypothetical protein